MTANPLSTIPPIGPTTGTAQAPVASRFKSVDPIRLLRQNFHYLILAGIIGVFIGGGAWVLARKFDPQYASEATLIAFGVIDDSKRASVGTSDSRDIPEIETFIRNQIAIITSEEMLRAAIQWPTVRNSAWYASFNGDIRRAAESLEEDHLRVSPQRDSTFFNLTVRMGNPAEAQDVLNALIEVYLQKRKVNTDNEEALLNSVQQRELERAERAIGQLKDDMDKFIQTYDLATVELDQSEAGIAFEQLNRQKIIMSTELNQMQASIEAILLANEEDPNRPMSEGEEQQIRMLPGVAQREEQLRQLNEIIRTNVEMGIGEEHRSIRQLKTQIVSVEQELETLKQTELRKMRAAQVASARQMQEGIKAQLAELDASLLAAHKKMQDLTTQLQRWETMQLDMEQARLQYADAQESLAELRAVYRRPDVSRVGRHKPPSEAELVAPMWYIWIPGITMLVVGLTAGLIFVRELVDQRVKTPADVKLLGDTTLLGLLPSAAEDPSAPTDVDRIVQKAPTGLMAESYRQVRTSVLSRMDRRGYKTLVVVGAQPGAGTSSVAQNLAASLAYNGRRVLIVDANFRRPKQHKLADISNSRGLAEVLREGLEPDEVIHRDGDLSLSVLPSGRGAEVPPEVLEGAVFRTLLGRLESEYDMVIIDAPPALLTSESQLLAKHVDAIAVVINAGVDQRGMVDRMLGKLDGQRADVLGVILNGVKTSAGGYFRKNYEDFYNYREDNGQGESTSGRNGKKDKALKKAAKEQKKGERKAAASDRGTVDLDLADDIEVLMAEDEDKRDA